MTTGVSLLQYLQRLISNTEQTKMASRSVIKESKVGKVMVTRLEVVWDCNIPEQYHLLHARLPYVFTSGLLCSVS